MFDYKKWYIENKHKLSVKRKKKYIENKNKLQKKQYVFWFVYNHLKITREPYIPKLYLKKLLSIKVYKTIAKKYKKIPIELFITCLDLSKKYDKINKLKELEKWMR